MATTEIGPKPSVSPQPPVTPPGSPTSSPSPLFVAVDDLKRFVVGLSRKEATDKVQTTTPEAKKDVPAAGSRARTSRLEFKTVDERCFPQLQACVVMQLER